MGGEKEGSGSKKNILSHCHFTIRLSEMSAIARFNSGESIGACVLHGTVMKYSEKDVSAARMSSCVASRLKAPSSN